MAKRDRDTAIWKTKFYKGLPPLYKCFWDFINDECDNAGVWLVDFSAPKIYIGKKINPDKALELFGDRIQVFDNGEKWHIKTFVSERLGFSDLNPAHKFQKSIIDLLVKHKIEKNGVYPDTLQSVKEREGQGQWEGQGKEREGSFEKSEKLLDFSQPDIQGDEIIFPIDTPAFRDLWASWKKYRWEVYGARYGMMGEQADLQRLNGIDFTQAQQTILTAIAGKWKNLYPEKTKTFNGNGTSKTKHQQHTDSLKADFAAQVMRTSGGSKV
jgi:hypothetical protein